VAFRLTDAQGNQDIWVRDLARGNNTRLTFDPRPDDAPVWSPDGKKIAFAANRGGSMDLYEKNADNSGEERLLFKSDQNKIPTSWSRDGRFVLFHSLDPKTANDLWVLPLDSLKPFVFLKSEFSELEGQFSPNGRWIAYMANPSGNIQIYVRPFSPESGSASGSSGAQWMVSTTDGVYPRWSSDGKRLFFVSLSGGFMAADVQTGASFQSGSPQRLFGSVAPVVFGSKGNDQFLFSQQPNASGPPPPFTVVLNWMSALNK
jgi:Tol biopolymer transport system component